MAFVVSWVPAAADAMKTSGCTSLASATSSTVSTGAWGAAPIDTHRAGPCLLHARHNIEARRMVGPQVIIARLAPRASTVADSVAIAVSAQMMS